MLKYTFLLFSYFRNSSKIKIKKQNSKESFILKLNNQKAQNELNWYPKLNFKDTIKLTVDWYKALENNDKLEMVTQKQIEFFLKKRSWIY